MIMRKTWPMLLMLALGVGIGLLISARLASVQARSKPGTGFAAVPGALRIGGPNRSLRSRQKLAARHQHSAWKRKMDVRRG